MRNAKFRAALLTEFVIVALSLAVSHRFVSYAQEFTHLDEGIVFPGLHNVNPFRFMAGEVLEQFSGLPDTRLVDWLDGISPRRYNFFEKSSRIDASESVDINTPVKRIIANLDSCRACRCAASNEPYSAALARAAWYFTPSK